MNLRKERENLKRIQRRENSFRKRISQFELLTTLDAILSFRPLFYTLQL